MATRRFAIFPVGDVWHVGFGDANGAAVEPVAGDDAHAADLSAVAAATRRLLDARGYRGDGVLLALPSHWCLSAAIPLPGPGEGGKRRGLPRDALLYEFEDHWPLAAEEVAADLCVGDGSVLGVAAPLWHLRPVLDALGAAGVRVESACPAALLAVAGGVDPGEKEAAADAGTDRVIVWQAGGGGAECFAVEPDAGAAGGLRVQGWAVLPDPRALRQHLAALRLSGGRPVRVDFIPAADSPWNPADWAGDDIGVRELPARDPLDAAALHGVRCLLGRRRLPVDLRNGPLADADRLRAVRRPLGRLVAAAALLLAAGAGAALWRAAGYDRLAAGWERQQAEVYAGAFPDRPPPIDPLLLLESEARKLEGLGGAAPLPRQTSALASLRDLLANLPATSRFELLELRLDPQSLLLQGRTRSHAGAEALADALRKSALFDPQPPRSEQRYAGDAGDAAFVSFTLTATVRPPPTDAPGPALAAGGG